MLSPLGVLRLSSAGSLLRKLGTTLIALPVVFACLMSIVFLRDETMQSFEDDGAQAVSNYLLENKKPEDTVLVWGYRPDIYIYLNELAPIPAANQMMIHPDATIIDRQKRLLHIHPGYQSAFLEWIEHDPPSYIVIAEEESTRWSPADEALHKKMVRYYREAFRSIKKDVSGRTIRLWVYRYNDQYYWR